jgi:uncharacterized membrane protein YhhN
MKKIPWGLLFLFVLAIYLVCIGTGTVPVQFACKCVLMPLLALHVISQSKSSGLRSLLLIAIFFSWLGDVVLLFQDKKEIFFMLGLAAFLIAHLFYIFLFHRIRVIEGVKSKAGLLLIVVVYYSVLIYILTPFLHAMKLPVSIYGIVISFMFMLAMHLLYIRDRKAGLIIMLGALLFVLSDSTLAINKFYHAFEGAGFIIMLTYGLAQFGITTGFIRYTRSGETS